MRILVIPSCRADSLREFFQKWKNLGGWDEVVVVEDNPEPTFEIETSTPVHHYSWADFEEYWIFSKKDSAIRAFGIWQAWRKGAEYVLSLDDDCYPIHSDSETTFFQQHIDAMEHPKWVPSVLNSPTRGMPYTNLGSFWAKVNVGLWQGVPDYDAMQLLSRQPLPPLVLPDSNRLIPMGQFFPVCGMNVCLHRDALPAFYYPLMGMNSPYARFDDIWAGLLLKRVMDHMGWSVGVGKPFVYHSRQSDTLVNLVKEAPGVPLNEWVWQLFDQADLTGCTSVVESVARIASEFQNYEHPYISQWGQALKIWSELFSE